jgi:hypothetical protein
MADSFKLLGSYEVSPLGSSLSFAPSVVAQINEARTLKFKHLQDIDLTADAPVNVSFGGVANAHVVVMKAVGGKVRARLTSAEGSQQAVPFDTYFILMSESAPVTAIDLTRVAGTTTSVRVFLGEKA